MHTTTDPNEKHSNTGAALEAEIDEIFGGPVEETTEEDEDKGDD